MIQVENIEVWGFEHAVRGMRNPMNSWAKSDSYFRASEPIIGKEDLALMRKLYHAGTSHRKFLRQIFVSCDIIAPLYWWKEFDTYKVGTVANSCSTMHKIHEKEFELKDFSWEHLTLCEYDGVMCDFIASLERDINELNFARKAFIETKDKKWWWQMIQKLPTSYNQKRTVTMSYENVMAIIDQRSDHKLDEWRHFCAAMGMLPYIKKIREES